MIIYFSPEYSGFCYMNLLKEKNKVSYNTTIVNITGLLNLLELHAGLHWKSESGSTRIILYYQAMRKYMQSHPNNILSKSFENDGLDTAAECLSWRDKLAFAGWNTDTISSKGRIEVLQGIENDFNTPGDAERIFRMIRSVQENCSLPPDMTVIIPCQEDLLMPIIQQLLNALKARGVRIELLHHATPTTNDLSTVRTLLQGGEIKNNNLKGDGSFKIFKFQTKQDALLRMSLRNMDQYDLWINMDNKAFDNMLHLQGQPLCGSIINNSFPLLSQLYIIGLGLFQKPLNLNNLLDWLQVPMSPISANTRRDLVETIVRSGGYFNDECKSLRKEIIKKEHGIEKILNQYLPSMETPENVLEYNEKADVKELYDFTDHLGNWIRQHITILQSKGMNTEAEQLSIVDQQTDAIKLLLKEYQKENSKIDYNKVHGWMGSLYKPTSFVQYESQTGCRNMIDNPGKIISQSHKTIWYGFNGSDPQPSTYGFLSPREKEEMNQLYFWDESKERKYRQNIKLMPFEMTTEELVLVVCENDGMQELPKNPFLIQLESTFEKKLYQPAITITPPIPKDLIWNDITVNNQLEDKSTIKIRNGKELKWPERESATSLENLIQNPLDYTLENLVHIDGTSVANMQDVYRTEGNVAHAVIAELFNKHEDIADSGTYPYIKDNINLHFNDVFNDQLVACGALLLQSENRVKAKILKEELRRCVQHLLEIIHLNRLHVAACEKEIENDQMGFTKGINIRGFLDMLLADDYDGLYIFDFKWTTSDRYTKMLQENRSLQLAIYEELTKKEIGNNVVAVGYFLMPRGILFSTHPFETCEYFEQQEIKENTETTVINEIRNSYIYRRTQIVNGNIEIGEGQSAETLPYCIDQQEKHLFPLSTDSEGNKYGNLFSNYGLFKQ